MLVTAPRTPGPEIRGMRSPPPVELWNPSTRKRIAATDFPSGAVAFSHDGRVLAIATPSGISLLDAPLRRKLGSLSVRNPPRTLAFSSNGKVLATAGIDGVMELWNPVTRKRIGVFLGDGAPDQSRRVQRRRDGSRQREQRQDGDPLGRRDARQDRSPRRSHGTGERCRS
jgi:hypothetical protein